MVMMFRNKDGSPKSGCPIKEDSASALWTAQCAHMEKLNHTNTPGNRLVFMDNFYTRHALGKALLNVTDSKVRIIGTVKLTNVDSFNTAIIQNACAQLKNARRGSWKLVANFESPPDLETQKKNYE